MWTPDIFEEQSEEPMELLVAGLLCVETENTDAEISGCPIPGKHSSRPFCITAKKSSRGRAVFLALRPRRLCVTPGLFPAGAAKGTQLPREGGTPRLLHPACPSEGLDWRWLSPWEQSGDTCGRHDGGCPWHPVRGDQGGCSTCRGARDGPPQRRTRPHTHSAEGGGPGLITWEKTEPAPCSHWTPA